MSGFDKKILKSLPIQFIESDNCVILKRGCTELRIDGKGAAEAIGRIFQFATDGQMTFQNICDQFPTPIRPAIREMVEQLLAKHILVAREEYTLAKEEPESSLDIFYWHFGETTQSVQGKLNEVFMDIVGVNGITRQLATSFLNAGFTNFQIIDYPLLRNLRLFDGEGRLNPSHWSLPITPLPYNNWADQLSQNLPTCLIAASDFGGRIQLKQWNQFCFAQNCHFFPIVLKDLVGYLGPHVIPRETACYECLLARENSHSKNPQVEQAVNQAAFQSQPFIGAHPSMSSILGDLASFELTKFYSGVLPGRNVGTQLEVNLLAPSLTSRKILKIPRCLVCSPLNRTASTQPLKETLVNTRENG